MLTTWYVMLYRDRSYDYNMATSAAAAQPTCHSRFGGAGCWGSSGGTIWLCFDDCQRRRHIRIVLALIIVSVSLEDGLEEVDGALRRRHDLHGWRQSVWMLQWLPY